MLRCFLILPLLVALPVEAGLFKCRLPDGSIVYQQTACAGAAEGAEVSVDTRSPGGAGSNTGAGQKDYSVESQLKAMESARKVERKQGEKAGKEARQPKSEDLYDRAKCAKHRAQTAHWRQEVRNGYRTQEEKAHDQHMLEYHQALVDRHCVPD